MGLHWSAGGQFAQLRADHHAVFFPGRQRDRVGRPAEAPEIDDVRVNAGLDIDRVAGFGGIDRGLDRLEGLGLACPGSGRRPPEMFCATK